MSTFVKLKKEFKSNGNKLFKKINIELFSTKLLFKGIEMAGIINVKLINSSKTITKETSMIYKADN